MKIINLDKGEAYELKPGTQLSVERTNPFFNDYGEMTVPMSMPASDHNMRLLGHPTMFGTTQKLLKADCAISDGDYYTHCRQAILSLQHKGSISTSFYMNDGSLYSRISDVKVKSVFENEYVRDAAGNVISTVADGIQFCRSLLANENPDYAIFPVLVEDDSGMDEGYNFKVINLWGKDWQVTDNGVTVFRRGSIDEAGCDFWGATDRTEYVEGLAVTLTPGYYITPFIRCNTVLRRIFSHFGYTLQDNFFTRTAPFADMVFVNNIIDTLVNGTIRISDLLPDVTARTVLDVFRKKFCCEFVADEGSKTVSVVFMKDMAERVPDADLTGSMTEEPEETFNAAYKRIVLKSQEQADGEASDTYDDLKAMSDACPTAYFDPASGRFYKTGFNGPNRILTTIGNCAQPYDTGQELGKEEVTVPDLFPEMRILEYRTDKMSYTPVRYDMLYVGRYGTLNSKMTTTATADGDVDSGSANDLKPILAIPYTHGSRSTARTACGIVTNYAPDGTTRLWDYSLLYNGEDGIFSRFWSYADRLYRNALDDIKVKLLLSQQQKQELPSTGKVVIRSTEFLFNKLKFTLGGKDAPVQSELKTLRIMQPEDLAPALPELLPNQVNDYYWEAGRETVEVSSEQYESAGADKDREFNVVYPPLPQAAYADGRRYFEQHSYTHTNELRWISPDNHGPYIANVYRKTTVWLTCRKR